MTLFVANALQCIVIGEENPKSAPSPWDFVTLSDEDRAAAIGNMHKKSVKIALAVPEICCRTDRQIHRHTDKQTCSSYSQYFATALAGEIKS